MTTKSVKKPKVKSWKEHFEANMLDGNSINDCGKAMISAEAVWDYIKEYLLTNIDEPKANKVTKAWAVVSNRNNSRIGGYQAPTIGQVQIFMSKQSCNKNYKCVRVQITEIKK